MDLDALFRTQVREPMPLANPGERVEQIGLVRRRYPLEASRPGALIESPDGLGSTEGEIEGAIAAQVSFFTGRGQQVEWKTYADDGPPDLVERLVRHGFVAQEPEALMLGTAETVGGPVTSPAGVAIREFSSAADWARVGLLMDQIWGPEHRWVNERLRAEQERDPALFRPVLAEAVGQAGREAGEVVAYAAVQFTPGVDFAGLWGGSTHPHWRGRGLYRALTAYRANRALEAGYPYVRVDASPHSAPILTRLGLTAVTTTTPCVLDPAG